MKKGLLILLAIVAIIAGGIYYILSGAGDLIKQQIEKQGSQYMATSVTVASVELALAEGRLTINGLDVANPEGFSQQNAFSLESITLDLGDVTSEPYTVQTLSVNAPEILYEVDASGSGNLLALKNNLMKNLPKSDAPAEPQDGANPLVIVENVTVSKVRLKLDFANLDTGDLVIEQKVYDVELPTFNAGAIGKPNGMPADQVGAAVVNKMLDNIIAQAKEQAKQRLKDAAKDKAMEKIDEEKDKLKDKAKDKLKNLLNNG
jgi:flagellar basal body-associated protein FliL